MVPVYLASLRARHSEKVSYIGGIGGVVGWGARIFRAAGSSALVSVVGSPPLTYSEDQLANVFLAAELGLPMSVASGVAIGANAPATLAGSLVQTYAEIAAAFTLAQTVRPGMSCMASDYSQPFDMRTGGVVQGGIERGLMGAAWAQLWRTQRVPCITRISSDAKVPDYQCAMEKVMAVTVQALAGSSIVNFLGGVYDELVISPVVAVMDNDVAHMVGRLLDGVRVDRESLAVDTIEDVGPVPGHYLDRAHTRDTWRKEQLIPDLPYLLPYGDWLKGGKKDILALTREKYEHIAATHHPAPLTADQDAEIDAIVEEARAHYRAKGLA